MVLVSIHAPARGATKGGVSIYPADKFQFTRPQGARPCHRRSAAPSTSVSIHAPARGATRGRVITLPSRLFQFTRPQGARLVDAVEGDAVAVSIHAPARGATQITDENPTTNEFQFTRPQGARHKGTTFGTSIFSFNSRARKGRDHAEPDLEDNTRCFNSRARKGRDGRRECLLGVRRRFNSRARKGRDAASSEVNCDMSSGFNSRARKGRDWRPPTCRASRRRFNSRARKGRDTSSTGSISTRTVSIHAPARGATRPRAPRFRRLSSFNSRARKGRDPRPLLIRISSTTFQFTRPQGARRPARRAALSAGFVSIHAPARGATSRRPRCPCRNPFQFTRPQGARRRNTNPFPATTRFNSRARKGRDPYSSTMTEFMHVSIHAPARGATPISSPCCRT